MINAVSMHPRVQHAASRKARSRARGEVSARRLQERNGKNSAIHPCHHLAWARLLVECHYARDRQPAQCIPNVRLAVVVLLGCIKRNRDVSALHLDPPHLPVSRRQLLAVRSQRRPGTGPDERSKWLEKLAARDEDSRIRWRRRRCGGRHILGSHAKPLPSCNADRVCVDIGVVLEDLRRGTVELRPRAKAVELHAITRREGSWHRSVL